MISNVVQNRFVINRRKTGSNVNISTIIPSASKVQVGTVVSLAFKANAASKELAIYPFHSALKTTLAVAATAADSEFELACDAGSVTVLNGQTIVIGDHLLIELNDGSWQLLTIAGVDGSHATTGQCQVSLDGTSVFDGDSDVRSEAAAGNTVYVLLAGDVIKRAAGTTEVEIEVPVACGEQGVPFAISLSSGATGEQYIGGLVEYTESRRITAPLTQH